MRSAGPQRALGAASRPRVYRLSVSCPQALLNQLRAVFDQIIELQNAQDTIYRAALGELQRRLQFEEKRKQREAEVRLFHQGLLRFDGELVASVLTSTGSFPAETILEVLRRPALGVPRGCDCSRRGGHPRCPPVGPDGSVPRHPMSKPVAAAVHGRWWLCRLAPALRRLLTWPADTHGHMAAKALHCGCCQ